MKLTECNYWNEHSGWKMMQTSDLDQYSMIDDSNWLAPIPVCGGFRLV